VRRPKAFEFQVDDPSQAEAEKTQLCRRDANRLNRPTPRCLQELLRVAAFSRLWVLWAISDTTQPYVLR